MAWCDFTADGLLVTATATKLLQAWRLRSNAGVGSEGDRGESEGEGGAEIVQPPLTVFPTSARIGSPDGVGGQGGVGGVRQEGGEGGRELVIGDEAGRLYRVDVGSNLPLPAVPAQTATGVAGRQEQEGGMGRGGGGGRGRGRGGAGGRSGGGMRGGATAVVAAKKMARGGARAGSRRR